MRWGWDEYNKKNDWNGYRILIDYFIPYRLDEPVSDTDELEPFTDERLLLELINRNVLGEASSVTERCVPFNEVVVGIGNDEVAYITFPKEAFGALCDLVYEPLGNSEQLERDEMDVIWRADDTVLSSSKDNVILKNTRNGETDKIVIWKHAFTEICLHWLDLQGYDVTKREPEILPCPYCGHDKLTRYNWRFTETKEKAVVCPGCGLTAPSFEELFEAIEAWNALPRKDAND
jgi:hypothetical protein